MNNHDPALLVGRIFGSSLFIVSGWFKLMAMAGTIGYFTKMGVPMPSVAYVGVVALELGGGLLLLVGFQTRLIALLMALFCVATALLAHSDFAAAGQLTHFLKNMALTGGYLAFVAAGAGRFSIDGALAARRA
jgi:putative oxidoreductase